MTPKTKQADKKNSQEYRTVSIPESLFSFINLWISEHEQYGFKTVTEFIKEAVRFRTSFDELTTVDQRLKILESVLQSSSNDFLDKSSVNLLDNAIKLLNDIGSSLGDFTLGFLISPGHKLFSDLHSSLLINNEPILLDYNRDSSIRTYSLKHLTISQFTLEDINILKKQKPLFDGLFILVENVDERHLNQLLSFSTNILSTSNNLLKISFCLTDNSTEISNKLEKLIADDNSKKISFLNLQNDNKNIYDAVIGFLQSLVTARTHKSMVLFPKETANKVFNDLYNK